MKEYLPLFGPDGTRNGPPAPINAQNAVTATSGIQTDILKALKAIQLMNTSLNHNKKSLKLNEIKARREKLVNKDQCTKRRSITIDFQKLEMSLFCTFT